MKAYFVLNASLYTTDKAKVMTTLNKMSSGRGASFTEMWYDKMADTNISSAEKMFSKFSDNFETTFYPFDTKATAYTELAKLIQKSFKKRDGTFNDGFQKYITDFQNLSTKAGITNDITLVDQFSLGLNDHDPLHVTHSHYLHKMDRSSQGLLCQKACIIAL